MRTNKPTKLKIGSRSSSYAAVLKRVGTSPEARTRWLIRFATINWDDLSLEKRITLQQEARVFFISSKALYDPNHLDPEELLLQWQTDIRDYLDKLKHNKGFILQPNIQYAFWVRNGKLCHQFRGTNDSFEFEISKALSAVGNHLRFCLHCQTPFVTTHRQRYCSTSCSQKVRIERYKLKDPERWQNRIRERYQKQVQKQHPKAKLRFQKREKSKRRADDGDLQN